MLVVTCKIFFWKTWMAGWANKLEIYSRKTEKYFRLLSSGQYGLGQPSNLTAAASVRLTPAGFFLQKWNSPLQFLLLKNSSICNKHWQKVNKVKLESLLQKLTKNLESVSSLLCQLESQLIKTTSPLCWQMYLLNISKTSEAN